MTRTSKKIQETALALEAAERLGKHWRIDEVGESPDLLVREDGQRFGLEVTEIHAGRVDKRRGSEIKMGESVIDGVLDALRRDYEAVAGVPLKIEFLGDLALDNQRWVLSQLIACDFPNRKIGDPVELDNDALLPLGEEQHRLRVWARRAFRPQWTSVDTTVGFVDFNPMPRITEAVTVKARNIAAYRARAGHDVRLLIVADRRRNSGKLALRQNEGLDLRGFSAVYFYSRPESVTTWLAPNAAPDVS